MQAKAHAADNGTTAAAPPIAVNATVRISYKLVWAPHRDG
jgi:hypothetical protein